MKIVSLMTPILVLLFGVHTPTAVETDLLYAAIEADPFAHIGQPTPAWRAVPKFDLRRVPCLGLMVCHRGPFEVIEIFKPCFGAAA